MKAIVRVKRTEFADIEVDIETEDDAEEAWLDATQAIHGTPAYEALWEPEEYDVVSVTWQAANEPAPPDATRTVLPRSPGQTDVLASDVLIGDYVAYGLDWMEVSSITSNPRAITFHGTVPRRGREEPAAMACEPTDLVATRLYSDLRPAAGA